MTLTPRQSPTFQCDRCGRARVVTPTISPWEFAVATCACGDGAIDLSWFHGSPPPRFDGAVPCLPFDGATATEVSS